MRIAKAIFLLLLVGTAAIIAGDWYVLPVKVDYFVVQPRAMTLDIVGPGLVDATNKVAITARIQGFLVSVDADKNDVVKRGQILAQLESTDLRNQAGAAKADTEAAKMAVTVAERERDRANALLSRARLEFARKTELIKTNTASQADFSNSESGFKEAEANFARSAVSIERAKAQSLSADATLAVLQAKLAEATIRAPIDGVVVTRDRNIGDLLSPGASLMQIVDPASIVISARFDESTMDAIRPGQIAKVAFASDPDSLFEGRVLRLIRQVDKETREYVVDVTLQKLPENWAMNQRANVSIEAQSSPSAISVPRDYIVRYDGRPAVWLARGGRAVWRSVSTGYASGNQVQITAGLDHGDIVLDPSGRYSYQAVQLDRKKR